MSNYVYFPNDRNVGVDFARTLQREAGWTPSIWLGHPRVEREAKEHFPVCKVYDYWRTNLGLVAADPTHDRYDTCPPPSLLRPDALRALRMQACRMMDRQDVRGRFRLIDREAIFARLLVHFYNELVTVRPAALIASETPHFAAHFIIFTLCKALEIPTFFFQAVPLARACFLKADVGKEPIEINSTLRNGIAHAKEDVRRYCASIGNMSHASSSTERLEPSYMQSQRLRHMKLQGAGYLIREVKSLLTAARDAYADPRPKSYGVLDQNHLLDLDASGDSRPRLRHTIKSTTHAYSVSREASRLQRSLISEHTVNSSVMKGLGDYVYFPLHYEPERTTNPEAGPHYDQLSTLIELRALMSDHDRLVVKEHPSQHYRSMRGHLGRSALVYKLIRQLPNTYLVPTQMDQSTLLKRARLVVTLTGTAALEAALLGTNAAVLGDSWFGGCPGVAQLDNSIDVLTSKSDSKATVEDIADYLTTLIDVFAIPARVTRRADLDDMTARGHLDDQMILAQHVLPVLDGLRAAS